MILLPDNIDLFHWGLIVALVWMINAHRIAFGNYRRTWKEYQQFRKFVIIVGGIQILLTIIKRFKDEQSK